VERVGRPSVVHPDEDEQLGERQSRERHADCDTGGNEKKFGYDGHTSRPDRKVRAARFASLAYSFGDLGNEGALFLPLQLHDCVVRVLSVTDRCVTIKFPQVTRGGAVR
jgi:hypothetical protein